MTPEIMRQYLAARAPELEVVSLPEEHTTEYISLAQIDLLSNSKFTESIQYLRGGDAQGIGIVLGMWWISPGGRKLTLNAGSDAAGDDMRSAWQVKDARTLRMLDQQGDSIASELNYELTRTDSLGPIQLGPNPPEFLASLANTRWGALRIGGHAVKVPAQQHEPEDQKNQECESR